MKFVLATHNPGKLKEMADILSGLGVEVVSPADVGISVDVEETGTTCRIVSMLFARPRSWARCLLVSSMYTPLFREMAPVFFIFRHAK